MLWIKALHIVFVVAWFAGLLYLPRLFVYHAETVDSDGAGRFCLMERRLFAITSIGMLGALGFGLWLVVLNPGWMSGGWLHAKLTLVAMLVAFHHWMILPMRAFRNQKNQKSARFYRWMNEVPAVLLVAIVILVVVKPF